MNSEFKICWGLTTLYTQPWSLTMKLIYSLPLKCPTKDRIVNRMKHEDVCRDKTKSLFYFLS